MELIIQASIIIHVIAGLGALISGAAAFALRRRTPKHKPAGKVYFWCMSVVFVTGLFLSLAKSLLFFFFIAVFTYYFTLIAYRSLRLKNLHNGQKPARLDIAIELIAGLAFAGLVGLGVLNYARHGTDAAIIPFVFGGTGLLVTLRNARRFMKPPAMTNYWLKIHAGNMIGSYIGAITAFLVNQTDKIPVNPVYLWIGPTVIILPVLLMELRKIKSEPLPLKQP